MDMRRAIVTRRVSIIFLAQDYQKVVGLGRLELPTTGLGNRCSIHLSYSPEAQRDSDSLPATVNIFTQLLEPLRTL